MSVKSVCMCNCGLQGDDMKLQTLKKLSICCSDLCNIMQDDDTDRDLRGCILDDLLEVQCL